MRRAALVLVSCLGLAACGEIENPDLGTGRVSGQLLNATSGAYVYPLGRPDLKVMISADGRWVIDRVPAETKEVVVIDGAAGDGTRKAQRVSVHVEGAEENEEEPLDAATMPLAGRVVATVQLACGAYASSPKFTAVGTEHVDVASVAGVAELDPLPAGNFELVASMHGFRNGTASVDVTAGATSAYTVPLDVDSEDGQRGCLAAGCRNGLVCNPADGVCYECNANADCEASSSYGAGSTCQQHACQMPSGTPGPLCAACAGNADCASGVCVQGYCSRMCSTSYDCAGWACQGSVCVAPAPGGCATYLSKMWSPCFGDETCRDVLTNGFCSGQDLAANPPVAGHCTARCSTLASPDVCAVTPAFTCKGMGSSSCQP